MKKLVILLSILILMSGCVQELVEKPAAETGQPAVEEPVTEEPVAEVPVAEEPVTEEPVAEVPVETGPEVISENVYKLKLDTPYTFEGTEVVVTDMDSSGSQFRADVGGQQILFIGTKEVEIADTLEMYVDSFENYGDTDPRTFIVMGIKKFVLGEDQYLVRKGSPIKLPDVNKTEVGISYTKVDSAGVKTATISVGSDSEDLIEGRTARFDQYLVTNLKTFAKDKQYALLKIVPR